MRAIRFFQSVYHDNARRRQNTRAIHKDAARYARNAALVPIDRFLVASHQDNQHPVVFIVGTPRSGTTLLFQLIARHLKVGYPSNFVARFWNAPVAGTALYLSCFREGVREIPLRSQYGGTEGPHSPHEFYWFWQWFAPFEGSDDRTDEDLSQIDWNRLRRELVGLAGIWKRPYVFKSLNHSVYNIERFAKELPQSYFLNISRDSEYVERSILKCRRERYGDPKLWWSIRPRDVQDWLDRDPIDQVRHQVQDIKRGIEAGLATVPAHRVLRTSYEDVVGDPLATMGKISRFLDNVELQALGELEALRLSSANR